MSVDERFFQRIGAATLEEIAAHTGAQLVGPADTRCEGIAASQTARAGELCFHEGDAAAAANVSAAATGCFVTEEASAHLPEGVAALVCRWPRLSHAEAAARLVALRGWETGSPPVSGSAAIHETARIAPGAVIGDDAAIGEAAVIGANAVIGPGVQIGRHTHVAAGASVMCALIGDHVSIGAGARIGEPGFGTMAGPQGAESAPQFGRVIIQDHARIGSNTCIDRGAFDDTVIGERTKIDNLCQIGHNVTTGRSVIIAAFGGISGSVSIGDGAMLGGRVGVADHVVVGDGSSLAASAGVFRNVPDGETWGGTPAKPIRQWMRETAWLQKQVSPSKKGK